MLASYFQKQNPNNKVSIRCGPVVMIHWEILMVSFLTYQSYSVYYRLICVQHQAKMCSKIEIWLPRSLFSKTKSEHQGIDLGWPYGHDSLGNANGVISYISVVFCLRQTHICTTSGNDSRYLSALIAPYLLV